MGCSTGDLEIETIDFDEANVQFCGTLTTETELFFKLNDSEALILQLESGLLANTDSGGEIESLIPGDSQLTYRVFDGDVSSSYFCGEIPPATPIVIDEIEAEAGSVLITTLRDASDTTRYEHEIRLAGISFVNSRGERLTNLSVDDFGTLTTTSN
nr:hypothetical protein [Robiginitalea sp. SC105]